MTSIAEREAAPAGNLRLPSASDLSQGTAIEQARAVAEVAAAVKVAQQNPRDLARAVDQMRQACQQPALAERAFYSLPRAGGRIEGSTVHLARELARCWGNADHGIRELRRDDNDGVSEMQAWAWDQEQNVRSSRSFIVPHARMVGRGADKRREALMDLGDIANNNNSVAARAVRETIFQIIPVWFRVEAESIATRTLQDGGGKTLVQQVADAVAHFRDTWNITVEQLEARLERPHDKWTVQDLAVLRVISGELTRGEKRAEDEFSNQRAPEQRVTAAEIQAARAPATEPTEVSSKEAPSAAEPVSSSVVGPITAAQSKKLHAVLGQLQVADRDHKLTVLSSLILRRVTSSKDLTRDEAKVIIDTLESVAQRDDPTGNLAFIVEAADEQLGGQS